jgi:hypothetical protein
VTPTAADPTEVQNGLENRFDRSKEEGSFLKNAFKRRKDRDGKEDRKGKKDKSRERDKNPTRLLGHTFRYGFQKRRIENDTTHG